MMFSLFKRMGLSGNPRALARLFVICLCVLIATVVAWDTGAEAKVVVGSFIGAGLSLAVNWLVLSLESEQLDAIPSGFLLAAKSDVLLAAYYRQSQQIRVSVSNDVVANSEIIELRFTAEIIPMASHVKVYYPEIHPPESLSGDFMRDYKVF